MEYVYCQPLKYNAYSNITNSTELRTALKDRFAHYLRYVRRCNEKSSPIIDSYTVRCAICGEEFTQLGHTLLFGADGGCPTCMKKQEFNRFCEPKSIAELEKMLETAPWTVKRGLVLMHGQTWKGYDKEYKWGCNKEHTFWKKPNDIRLGGPSGDCPICHKNNELSTLKDDVILKVLRLSEHIKDNQLSAIDAFLVALQIDDTCQAANFLLQDLTSCDRNSNLEIKDIQKLKEQEDNSEHNTSIQDRIRLISNYVKDDEDAVNGLYATIGNDLWRYLLKNYESRYKILAELREESSPIVKRFLKEFVAVSDIEIPSKILKSVGKANKTSTLVQQLIAFRLLQNKYYGNWAGTGVGKTTAAVLATHVASARVVVYVAVNSTISQTIETFKKCFGGGIRVFEGHKPGCIYTRDEINVIVMNYQKFHNEHYIRKTEDILCQHIDLLIIDEIQNVKHRGSCQNYGENAGSKESQQRDNLLRFQQKALLVNSQLYTLGMSATPVVNEPNEAISILRFLGYKKDIGNLSSKNLVHLVQAYNLLQEHGFRYKPELSEFVGYEEKNISISGISLDDLMKLCEKPTILEIENILLDYKLRYLKKLIKDKPGEGFFLYTHFVGISENCKLAQEDLAKEEIRIINKIKDTVLEIVPEKDIRFFTSFDGNDSEFRKNVVAAFATKEARIIIASRPISTGVNGLQERNSHINLVNIILPWTSVDYDQILGRIVRQGSKSRGVTIYNLLASEYDNKKWDRINFKRTVFDTMTEGKIPDSLGDECLNIVGDDVVSSWKELANKIENGEIEVQEETVVVDVTTVKKVNPRKKRKVTNICSKLKKASPENMATIIKKNRAAYLEYQISREKSLKNYPENPRNEIAKSIENKYPNTMLNIVDAGCGYKAFLQDRLPFHMVHSVEFTNEFDARIIQEYIENLDQFLKPDSMDVVVFSLVFNWGRKEAKLKRIRAAKNVLKSGGLVYVAEPRRARLTPEKIISFFEANQFRLIEHKEEECLGKYYYLTFKL